MHLKSIDIYGFKSFAEKTALNFSEGVTAIVGPNGCGKTNITDAIKWVLGEQSAKSLRGTKMEDIIFNGTSSRKATSISEVTLVFDNSQNVLPIDYSEVAISRRLYRSGESEYYLNKTPVRLRDIKDLLLDTGIGTDSYSIMEQGKIDFILQAKPEERRYLFEEVAGVSKFKSKKEEALRKLEKVSQDMLRLNDILVELESQKSKLDSQARKARQYQKYLEELKNYEVNSLVKKYFDVKNINTEKSKELETFAGKESQISMEIDKVEARDSEFKLKLVSKEDELIAKRTEANKVDSAIHILKERIVTSENGKNDLLKYSEESKIEIQQNEKDLDSYKIEFQNTQLKFAESEKIVASSNEILEKKTAEKNKLESEITALNCELENVRQEIFNIAKEISDFHNNKKVFEDFLNDINQRIEKTENQKQQTISQKSEKERVVNELRLKVQNIQTQLDENKKQLEQLNLKRGSLQQEIIVHQKALSDNKNILVHLNIQLETTKNDSDYALISKVKETFGDKICGIVSDVISVSAENITVVQTALGEKSNYFICEKQETAIEIINWLRENNHGWATFLILSEIEKIHVSQSLSFTGKQVIDFISCDAKFKKVVEFLVQNTTYQNDNIYSSGIIQGGKKVNTKKGGLEINEEINRLNLEILNINSSISKSEELINNLQNEFLNEEASIKVNFETTEKNKNDLFSLSKDLMMEEEALKIADNFLGVLNHESENFKRQKSEKEENLRQINESVEKSIQKEQEIKNRFSEIQQQFNKYQEDLKKHNQEITDMTVDFSVKNTELLHSKDKLKTISDGIELLSSKIESTKKWMDESQVKIKEFEKVINDSNEEINKIIVSKDSMHDAIKNIEKERDELKNELLAIENSLRSLRGQHQKLQDEVRVIERTVSGSASEMKQIENRLNEEKGIKIEDAINSYQEMAITSEELEKLKKRIESLGAVNLAAPEEYEQLEQRYNFLSKQREDLEKAREDLHNAINKINLTTRQNFQKTFIVVQENFRSIFTKLFEGGEADLLLTDEGNLLETGIDIIAQPPGKKLQHISLLSGGERSLTAIALLFAIYLVKPAPFCILDEIDGQLDEANVLRFTRMLKEFAKISQFFVITHNKRTMESANVLYGVTMEELGISKIISVQLEREKVPVS